MTFAPEARRPPHHIHDEDLPGVSVTRTLRSGIVAGEIAGLAMAGALMAIYSLFLHRSPFFPLQVVGATVHAGSSGESLDVLGFAAGLAVHQLVPALFWGLVFGALVIVARPERALSLMFLGLAVGVLAQIVDVYILLPHFAHGVGARSYWALQIHPATSWLVHLVYGLALSFFPWKYDPVTRRFA